MKQLSGPRIVSAFFAGMMVELGLLMAYQDWLGLDKYIEYARRSWITMPWWVGGLVALAFALRMVRIMYEQYKDDEFERMMSDSDEEVWHD